MSEPDGRHFGGYDPAVGEHLVAEAADIVRSLGFAASHVVLIGGLVPGLLVPVLDPGIEPHLGTADIDLCLSVALIEGDTVTYERMEAVLRRLGFQESGASFRWRRASGVPVTVEFFCPAGDDRPAGHVFRPVAADNPTGKHNLGGRLSALALDAGDTLTTDVEIITREVVLPDNKGTVPVTLRVTGPLGFLVAKSQALIGPTARDKPKDAYDIVWLVESWPGWPAAAAAALSTRPLYGSPQVTAAVNGIAEAFRSGSHVGARSYARFLAPSSADEPRLERRAVGAIAEFPNSLPR